MYHRTPPAVLAQLRRIAATPPAHIDLTATERTKVAVTRIEALRIEGDELDRALGDSKRELQRLRTLNSTIASYGSDLSRQRDRVRGFDWFSTVIPQEHACPICGTPQQSARQTIEDLRRPIEELERLASSTSGAGATLDKEILAVENRIRETERKLFANRRVRRELETEAEVLDSPSSGQRLEDVYMFLGGIRQALESIREVEGEDGSSVRLRDLQNEIRDLERRLLIRTSRLSMEDVARSLSDSIQAHAESMGLGHTDLRPVLDQKELNLRFIPPDAPLDSHGDLLWEIGSAANWMGYHLATFVALHEYLLGTAAPGPVPDFLIIDQPSQAYFPSDTYEERVQNAEPSAKRLSDLAKTRQIFQFLANVKSHTAIELQFIVVEHADERTWVGLEHIVEKVRDWRGGGGRLIPDEWLRSPE